jgi:hypothetical protein
MTVAKTVKKAAKSVKSATGKVARKINKAVVEPVAGMFHADGKKSKKSMSPTKKASTSHAKKAKK